MVAVLELSHDCRRLFASRNRFSQNGCGEGAAVHHQLAIGFMIAAIDRAAGEIDHCGRIFQGVGPRAERLGVPSEDGSVGDGLWAPAEDDDLGSFFMEPLGKSPAQKSAAARNDDLSPFHRRQCAR